MDGERFRKHFENFKLKAYLERSFIEKTEPLINDVVCVLYTSK